MKIRISPEDKKIVSDLAWRQHTTVSVLVRQRVAAYLSEGTRGLNLPPVLKVGGLKDAIYFIPDAPTWDAALIRAQSEGFELASLVRNALIEDANG